MKLGYIIYYVKDVEETLTFYEKAFGFERKFITPEKDYGETLSGETTLSFASYALGERNFDQGFTKAGDVDKPFGVELALVTADIETHFKRALDAGAKLYQPLTEKPWGQTVGYLLDNNGFLIGGFKSEVQRTRI